MDYPLAYSVSLDSLTEAGASTVLPWNKILYFHSNGQHSHGFSTSDRSNCTMEPLKTPPAQREALRAAGEEVPAEPECLSVVEKLGQSVVLSVSELGDFSFFVIKSLAALIGLRAWMSKLARAIFEMGVRCMPIIITVGCFTGLIIGLQGYRTLARFGSESALGSTVAVSLVDGLAPVLAALMVVGQAGSALAAELGIQRDSEQIDAIETMGINPLGYFVAPRLIAALIVFPVHTALFDIIGIIGGYVSGVLLLGQQSGVYWQNVHEGLEPSKVEGGLVKSLIFGFVVTAICAFEGYNTHRRSDEAGARGVSQSTTRAVVYSSIAVLTLDYLITSVQR